MGQYDSSFPARTIRKHKVMASKVLLAALVAVASAAGPPAPYAPRKLTLTCLQSTITNMESTTQNTPELFSHIKRTVLTTTPPESTESTFPMVVFRLSPTLLDPKAISLM